MKYIKSFKPKLQNLTEDPDFNFEGNDYNDDICFPPNNITNGYYEPLDDFYEIYSNVTYYCDEGYYMKGFEGPYNCTEEGEFDIEELPSCESLFLSMLKFYFLTTTFDS